MINGWYGLLPLFDQATEFDDLCLLQIRVNAIKVLEEAKKSQCGASSLHLHRRGVFIPDARGITKYVLLCTR